MVKFLSLFGAIYFLGLTLVPCADFEPYSNLTNSELQELGKSHDHDHENSQDDCSPLCYCQCCQISIVLNEDVIILFDRVSSVVEFRAFYQGIIPDTPKEIFLRPPRV